MSVNCVNIHGFQVPDKNAAVQPWLNCSEINSADIRNFLRKLHIDKYPHIVYIKGNQDYRGEQYEFES